MPYRMMVYRPPSTALINKGEEDTASYPGDYVVVAVNVKCRLESTVRQAREENIGGRLTTTGKWVNASPAGDPWQANKSYALGDVVLPTVYNGLRYVVAAAGISGASEPIWPTTTEGLVINGTVSFREFTLSSKNIVRLTNLSNRDFQFTGPVSGAYVKEIEERWECDEVT